MLKNLVDTSLDPSKLKIYFTGEVAIATSPTSSGLTVATVGQWLEEAADFVPLRNGVASILQRRRAYQ
jgi:hypothetical protein